MEFLGKILRNFHLMSAAGCASEFAGNKARCAIKLEPASCLINKIVVDFDGDDRNNNNIL